MDISKAKKPIHIVCPNCKKDLQYNGSSIKSQKEGMIRRLESLDDKLKGCRDAKQRKILVQQKKETLFKLKLLSEDVHMLSQLSEVEKLKIFKRLVKQIIPENQYMELIEKAEKQYLEDNTFNYYDLAIQRYNNFNDL